MKYETLATYLALIAAVLALGLSIYTACTTPPWPNHVDYGSTCKPDPANRHIIRCHGNTP